MRISELSLMIMPLPACRSSHCHSHPTVHHIRVGHLLIDEVVPMGRYDKREKEEKNQSAVVLSGIAIWGNANRERRCGIAESWGP